MPLVSASLASASDKSIVGWGSQVVGADLGSGLQSVTAGLSHTLGLKPDGSIVTWGQNYHGQCSLPEPNADFVEVAAGDEHSFGLKSDGSSIAGCGNVS